MHRTDWDAYAPLGEVHARARGRASVNAIRRDRAEVRRRTIAWRLPALRDEAWAACPEGAIPRVGVGGIRGASVRALADEFSVHPSMIMKDIQLIDAQDLRRLDLATRLPRLREEARAQGAKGHPTRLPKPVVYALSREFGVTAWTIRQDIRDIDASTPRPRRKTVRDLRFAWARDRRPRTLPRRVSVRLSEETYQAAMATGDAARFLRESAEARLGTGGAHTLDECAFMVAQACDPDTQDRLVRRAERLKLPIVKVLASLLLVQSQKEA